VAGEKFDQKRATNRRDWETDAQDAGDLTALRARDLVGQNRHQGGE
jgi:hypothetical protein